MTKFLELKSSMEKFGFEIRDVTFLHDTSITIVLFKPYSKHRDIGQFKTVYIPPTVSDNEYNKIFHYLMKQLGVPKAEK